MPKIENWETVEKAEELTGGEKLEPTGYKCKIIKVMPKQSKNGNEYYQFIFDIAEGSQAGRFSEAFYRDKEWLHAFNLFVHTDQCIGIAKRTLGYITDSNAGFDAEAAFLTDNWKLFEGKKIGVTFGLEEYTDQQTGDTKTSVKPRSQKRYDEVTGEEKPKVKLLDGTMVSVKEYEAGTTMPPAPTEDSVEPEYHEVAETPEKDVYGSDIPF